MVEKERLLKYYARKSVQELDVVERQIEIDLEKNKKAAIFLQKSLRYLIAERARRNG
jgi:hypothetical protein